MNENNEARMNNDPIKKFEKVLSDENILTSGEKEALWQEIREQVQSAKEYAMSCEFPSAQIILDPQKLYSNPWEAIK